jgi:hypothetical protein
MKKGIGRVELERYQAGKRLTTGRAIKAKCYDCMGQYIDGRVDCKVITCPLYSYMPYKGKYDSGQYAPPKLTA